MARSNATPWLVQRPCHVPGARMRCRGSYKAPFDSEWYKTGGSYRVRIAAYYRRMISNSASGTNIHEIAADIYRINTPVAIPGTPGFNFNQYLVVDDAPFLFHTGL